MSHITHIPLKTRIQQAISRLESGLDVRNQQLRTLLGEEGFEQYLDECNQQSKIREMLRNPPEVIGDYQRLMRSALFAYAKADAASRRGSKKAGSLFDRSDKEFERLLEFLREQIVGDCFLESWFDRPLYVSGKYMHSLTPDGVPRIVTSRSLSNQKGGLLRLKTTKHQLKLDALERALQGLADGDSTYAVEARVAQARSLRRCLDS
ncbi:hypothetical protein [Celeribacter sp.]|uniref:hypothetical protein n=1 Tax=Celeribacter sp. TaxID=1890673 RepID=UPI003A90BF10